MTADLEGLEGRVALVTFEQQGASDAGARAISPVVPATAIVYLLACDEPMRYSGQVVDGPSLVDELGL